MGVEGFCLGRDGGSHSVQQFGSPIVSNDVSPSVSGHKWDIVWEDFSGEGTKQPGLEGFSQSVGLFVNFTSVSSQRSPPPRSLP